MREKVAMRKVAGRSGIGLVPADDEARETIARVKDDAVVLVEVWRPRSVQHHRLYFGLLKYLAEATGRTTDRLRAQVMVALDRCDTLRQPNGDIVKIPQSIAFASMPQDEFNKLFEESVAFFADAFQMAPQDLLDEFFTARPELRPATQGETAHG